MTPTDAPDREAQEQELADRSAAITLTAVLRNVRATLENALEQTKGMEDRHRRATFARQMLCAAIDNTADAERQFENLTKEFRR